MSLDYARPNTRLLRELGQVARESARLADALRGTNRLPQTFPREAMDELCLSLSNLDRGTAEGCVEPLNFARHMLPLVRRDHFHIEGDEPEASSEEEVILLRDHQLDLAITRLYGAVGTALDEYRAQAQDRYDDRVGAEEIIELPRDGTFKQIDDKARAVAEQAKIEAATLADWALPGSDLADSLIRQVQDSANIAHSTQSQIRIRPIVARWYDSAAKAARKLPDVMIKTAGAIRMGTDITQIGVETWSGFKKRLRFLAYDQLRDLADALEKTGERLKRGLGPVRAPVERQRDPDVAEAEARVKALLLAGEPIPKDLAERVERLVFSSTEGVIQRPGDLLLLRNMRELVLGANWLGARDMAALGHLPLLESLTVNAFEAEDISALGQLANLTSLKFYAPKAKDVSALGQLSNLTDLAITANGVTDVSALGQLSNLTSLHLQGHNVRDISALAQLSGLTQLLIDVPGVADISALGQLGQLTSFKMQSSATSDVSALGQLSKLTTLSLHAPKVQDISALGQLALLTSLTVYVPRVRDVSALGQLAKLTTLAVQSSEVTDVSALGQLSNLTNLGVFATKVSDVSALGQLSGLTSLSLQTPAVRNISALGQLSKLEKLSLLAGRLSNLSVLGQLQSLTSLTMQANDVDLSGLRAIKGLEELKLSGSHHVDLAPLASMTSLKKLTLASVTHRNLALLKGVEVEIKGESRPA